MVSIFCVNKFDSEQWWCTEYAEDINDALRKRELDRFTFGFKAPQMEWRAHLTQYMLRVAEKHKLARTTIHLGELKQTKNSVAH